MWVGRPVTTELTANPPCAPQKEVLFQETLIEMEQSCSSLFAEIRGPFQPRSFLLTGLCLFRMSSSLESVLVTLAFPLQLFCGFHHLKAFFPLLNLMVSGHRFFQHSGVFLVD